MQVWKMAGILSEVNHAFLVTNSSIYVIFSLLQNLSHDHVQRFASICWSLWMHSNLKLWKNENEMCANVVDRARLLIKDWKDANIIHT
jgi:hypothetical protein